MRSPPLFQNHRGFSSFFRLINLHEVYITLGSGLELMAPSNLSIVYSRFAPDEMRHDEERLNILNKALLERLQLGGRTFLSSTILQGRFILSACIVNPRSTEQDIDLLAELVQQIGSDVLRETHRTQNRPRYPQNEDKRVAGPELPVAGWSAGPGELRTFG
jgi:hypothetical protein